MGFEGSELTGECGIFLNAVNNTECEIMKNFISIEMFDFPSLEFSQNQPLKFSSRFITVQSARIRTDAVTRQKMSVEKFDILAALQFVHFEPVETLILVLWSACKFGWTYSSVFLYKFRYFGFNKNILNSQPLDRTFS